MFSLCVGDAEVLIDQQEDKVKLTFCGYQPQSEEIEGQLVNFSLDYFKNEHSYVVTALASRIEDDHYHDFNLHAWLLDTKDNTVNHIVRTIDGEYITTPEHIYFTVSLKEDPTTLELHAKNKINGQSHIVKAFTLAD